MKAFALTLVLSAIWLVAPVIAEEPSPNEVIESAVTLLAEKLDGRQEELAADRPTLYALIDEILLPRFDRKFAAQMVLARNWTGADTAQRERFIEGFYQALLRRYADGLLEFKQDRVKVLPFRGDLSKPRAMVRSTVAMNDGRKIAVDYELVKRSSGWQMFNVVIEGISYIRNYRTELDAEIRSSSLDAVIDRLEEEAGIPNDG
ncbi:MAG: ABC transporter substrate-binding protein [Woeseiaceae bacterium]|nr:ABC transporter substrate-binding protein [Woeseiaceae bacterium]